jgi:hypothetical protein
MEGGRREEGERQVGDRALSLYLSLSLSLSQHHCSVEASYERLVERNNKKGARRTGSEEDERREGGEREGEGEK